MLDPDIAALDFWSSVGWDSARARQRSLVDAGAAVVAAALGTAAPVRDEFRAAMRVIGLPDPLDFATAHIVEAALARDHRVEAVITNLHETSWVRVSGQVYNTAGDYERLATALPDVLEAASGVS